MTRSRTTNGRRCAGRAMLHRGRRTPPPPESVVTWNENRLRPGAPGRPSGLDSTPTVIASTGPHCGCDWFSAANHPGTVISRQHGHRPRRPTTTEQAANRGIRTQNAPHRTVKRPRSGPNFRDTEGTDLGIRPLGEPTTPAVVLAATAAATNLELRSRGRRGRQLPAVPDNTGDGFSSSRQCRLAIHRWTGTQDIERTRNKRSLR